jgi:hypothetical protein
MHDQLDMIHKEAFDMAFNALRNTYEEFEAIGTLRKAAKRAAEKANVIGSKEKYDQAEQIEKGYLERLRQDFKSSQQ